MTMKKSATMEGPIGFEIKKCGNQPRALEMIFLLANMHGKTEKGVPRGEKFIRSMP